MNIANWTILLKFGKSLIFTFFLKITFSAPYYNRIYKRLVLEEIACPQKGWVATKIKATNRRPKKTRIGYIHLKATWQVHKTNKIKLIPDLTKSQKA